MFRHTEEHQLPLLWWCALSAGRAPGFPVCWLWPIMLFEQTLFLIGLHPLPWQRGWGNAFEGLGYCSLLLFYTLFVYWWHISSQWWAVRQGCSACTLCVCVVLCPKIRLLPVQRTSNIKASLGRSPFIYIHESGRRLYAKQCTVNEMYTRVHACIILNYHGIYQSTMVYAILYIQYSICILQSFSPRCSVLLYKY